MTTTKTTRELRASLLTRQVVFEMDLDIANLLTVSNLSQEPAQGLTWPEYLEAIKDCQPPITKLPKILFAKSSEPTPTPLPTPHLTGTVITLLTAIICDGSTPHFVLADALEEAGYQDQDALTHLRRPHHQPSCRIIYKLLNELQDKNVNNKPLTIVDEPPP